MQLEKIVTLKDAKLYLRENYKSGTSCPCCDQFVKMYKRKLTGTMVFPLITLSKKPTGYHHLGGFITHYGQAAEFAKTRFWNLTEQLPNDDDSDDGSDFNDDDSDDGSENEKTKKHSGYWKITELGKQFIRNEITVSKYILLYNKKFYRFDGEQINIITALGNKFNYYELMNNLT